ncbi:hypothetical protein BKE38_27440 [Pseudoroseomonas deserti]|uniref:Uncharacterized protein n=1 Tax=Teichococcus deserti TaxID=1817963 RepID=A0A1V2GUU6_9PROT|nr:hypothetical protein [Pseudoroseomonas deserti]ONG44716.1 hypothetical protein BKE38_27440 [Pseudoroseomonas deserti]
MQINRRGPGEASLAQDGRELADLVAAEASEAEFELLLHQLEALLALRRRSPRIALTYQGGLLGAAHAELPVQLILIEEDPHDEPPLRLVQRSLPADAAALEAAVSLAERRLATQAARQGGPQP